LSSWYNDLALGLIEWVPVGAQDMFWTHIWQDTSAAHPNSQRDSRDEASVETAHQEEETMTILDRWAG
jgi:hypothetical protein